MARLNRVDPFGDLHAVAARGMFTGNRGCLVDESGAIVRHYRGRVWITCLTEYKDWRSPLLGPGHWTPLFFLDDAVALAAGHRPCGLCRRAEYESYRSAVTAGLGWAHPLSAVELDRRLAAERMSPGRGLDRAGDRRLWRADIQDIPDGSVIVDNGEAALVFDGALWTFDFTGWNGPKPLPGRDEVSVLTPPTSVTALRQGHRPVLHASLDPGA